MANSLPAARQSGGAPKQQSSPAQRAVQDVWATTRNAKFRAQVLSALPPRMKGEKAVDYFCSGIYSTVRRNPDLVTRCRVDTLWKAAIEAAERGLRVDNGEAWLVPYKGEVALQVGYKGAIKLAKQAGILMIDAQAVYSNDPCTISLGTDPHIDHKPAMSNRGEFLGVYAWIRMSDGEPPLIEWMPAEEVEKIRKSSPSANSPAWRTWYEEMARAKVLKRIAKRVPAKDELDLALSLADADDKTIEGEFESGPILGVIDGDDEPVADGDSHDPDTGEVSDTTNTIEHQPNDQDATPKASAGKASKAPASNGDLGF